MGKNGGEPENLPDRKRTRIGKTKLWGGKDGQKPHGKAKTLLIHYQERCGGRKNENVMKIMKKKVKTIPKEESFLPLFERIGPFQARAAMKKKEKNRGKEGM